MLYILNTPAVVISINVLIRESFITAPTVKDVVIAGLYSAGMVLHDITPAVPSFVKYADAGDDIVTDFPTLQKRALILDADVTPLAVNDTVAVE